MITLLNSVVVYHIQYHNTQLTLILYHIQYYSTQLILYHIQYYYYTQLIYHIQARGSCVEIGGGTELAQTGVLGVTTSHN